MSAHEYLWLVIKAITRICDHYIFSISNVYLNNTVAIYNESLTLENRKKNYNILSVNNRKDTFYQKYFCSLIYITCFWENFDGILLYCMNLSVCWASLFNKKDTSSNTNKLQNSVDLTYNIKFNFQQKKVSHCPYVVCFAFKTINFVVHHSSEFI